MGFDCINSLSLPFYILLNTCKTNVLLFELAEVVNALCLIRWRHSTIRTLSTRQGQYVATCLPRSLQKVSPASIRAFYSDIISPCDIRLLGGILQQMDDEVRHTVTKCYTS